MRGLGSIERLLEEARERVSEHLAIAHAPKVLVRLFNGKGEVTKQEGDPSADPVDDVILDIKPFPAERAAQLREGSRVH